VASDVHLRLAIVSAFARKYGPIPAWRCAMQNGFPYVRRMKIVYHNPHMAWVRVVKSADLYALAGPHLAGLKGVKKILIRENRIFLPASEGPLHEDAAGWVLQRIQIIDGKLVAKTVGPEGHPVVGFTWASHVT
jgi:hypothetical protein